MMVGQLQENNLFQTGVYSLLSANHDNMFLLCSSNQMNSITAASYYDEYIYLMLRLNPLRPSDAYMRR